MHVKKMHLFAPSFIDEGAQATATTIYLVRVSRAFIICKESFFRAYLYTKTKWRTVYTKVSGDNFCADIGIIIYLNADALGCLN